ncbi:hypothetical protein GCM10022296_01020 [Secundilactobacillus similis DSM 23365 = JCM 2765]
MKPVMNWPMMQEQLLWYCVSTLHRIFKDYQRIRGVKIEIYFNDDIEHPGYTYENRLE